MDNHCDDFKEINEIELWHGKTKISEYFEGIYFTCNRHPECKHIVEGREWSFDNVLVTKNKIVKHLYKYNGKNVCLVLKVLGNENNCKCKGTLEVTPNINNLCKFNIKITEGEM